MKLFKLFVIPTVCVLASCSTNPHYDATKAHHTKDGFRNIYYQDDKGTWVVLKWKWEQLFKDLPDAGDYHFNIDTSRHHLLGDNPSRTSLTWIGHATFLLQFAGLNILTDPHFTERASPLSWAGPEEWFRLPWI